MAVGAGSCVGGVARYVVSRLVQSQATGLFPWGTLAVNVAGCLIIGLVYGLMERGCRLDDWMRLFLTVGFCGGFTTFSTFMHENRVLFESPHPWLLAVYASASLALGLGALYLGHKVASI